MSVGTSDQTSPKHTCAHQNADVFRSASQNRRDRWQLVEPEVARLHVAVASALPELLCPLSVDQAEEIYQELGSVDGSLFGGWARFGLLACS